LRQMRCNYIRAVGATLFPYVPTSSVITGRDTAKNVFVECKIASKKRSMAAPTILYLSTDEAVASGTDKSVPYKDAVQNAATHYWVA
jgi:hypothetical protein